jgi:ferric-dicitrate binding protein FerR (iron transport regulator)
MSRKVDHRLVKKFLEGKCTEAEAHLVMSWMQSETGLEEEVEKVWDESGDDEKSDEFREKIVLHRIYHKIDPFQKEYLQDRVIQSKQRRKNLYFTIAASLFFFCVSSLLWWQFNQDAVEEVAVVRIIEKSTSKGQKSSFFLPDGTEIRLNSASTLMFPEEFPAEERVVELQGEAYFQVKEDSLRPFKVITGNFITQVLGTTFNVEAYPEQNNVRVALETGKVDILRNGQSEMVLLPGRMAVAEKDSQVIQQTTFDAKKVLAWKDNILYFEDASWPEIKNELEHWYGVDFDVNNFNPKRDKLYTGEFQESSLEMVLESMSFTKNFDFEIEGKDVQINFKNS